MTRFKKILMITATCIFMLFPSSTAYAAKYTVQKNDTLTKISKLFNISVKTLKTDNKLKSDIILIGQKLEVNAKTYTVKSGDTMFLIAKKYNILLASLMKANNIYSDLIYPGQKLIIPGIKAETASGNTAASTSTSSKTSASGSLAAKTSSVIPYTNAELDLLARLIEAETGGESYNARVAVGAVVINRVQSKDWAANINDVIYQKYGDYYQFTPVQNGMIKKAASEDSINAAKEALSGKDPSKGAIYYYDNSSTNTWIKSKEVTVRLGNMIFAK